MKIRVIGQAGEAVFPFSKSGPWLKFRDNLLNDKDTLITEKFGQKIDVLICHGYSKRAISEANKSKTPKKRRILVLWEPPIINPKLHSDKYLSNFGTIYAPSKEWAKKYNVQYFNWPVGSFKTKSKLINFKNRDRNPVIIQSNKLNFFKGENYSLRRTILFESLNLKYPIILYGNNWRELSGRQILRAFLNFLLNMNFGVSKSAINHIRTKYPHYIGVSMNKFTTLGKYQISIVIENHNSYVSEKLFDSLNSKCVTIYVGPNLVDYGLNRNIAIQSASNLESVLNTLKEVTKLKRDEIRKIQRTQSYHLDKVIQNWNNDLVLTDLAKKIRNEIKK